MRFVNVKSKAFSMGRYSGWRPVRAGAGGKGGYSILLRKSAQYFGQTTPSIEPPSTATLPISPERARNTGLHTVNKVHPAARWLGHLGGDAVRRRGSLISAWLYYIAISERPTYLSVSIDRCAQKKGIFGAHTTNFPECGSPPPERPIDERDGNKEARE